MTDSLHCPACGQPKPENKRYPNYLCRGCAPKIEDEAGRRLSITNSDSADGIFITYLDSGEERKSRECFVQGIRCHASEAHFGGVVIQAIE